jgi:hypothetical protein
VTVRKCREQRAESEKGQRVRAERRECFGRARVFWFRKMVYGNIFRKPFSVFYSAILRSKKNIFSLTLFYVATNACKC